MPTGLLQSRPSTRFLKRFILPSDDHPFVGRIYDLSILAYHFDDYAELARHADCKYAFDVYIELSTLTRRVESLNLVGNMLWPPVSSEIKEFPVSRYDWLAIATDVFLMRYISVVDRCCCWRMKYSRRAFNTGIVRSKTLRKKFQNQSRRSWKNFWLFRAHCGMSATFAFITV